MNFHLPLPDSSEKRAEQTGILQMRESVIADALAFVAAGTSTQDHEVFVSVETPAPLAESQQYAGAAETVSSTRQDTVVNTLYQSRAKVEARNNVYRALNETNETSTPIPEAFPATTSTQPNTPYSIEFYEEAQRKASDAYGDLQ